MKHTLIIFVTVVITFSVAKAQDSLRPISQFLLKRGYTFPGSAKRSITPDSLKQWPDTLYYNTQYKSKLLGSITVPFYFSNVELHDGNISLSPAVNIGVGYTWFWGNFEFNEDDKIIVDPKLFFGLVANTGLQNGLSLKQGGLFTGAFVGVSALTLIFGYDIINKSPSIGAGGRIDFYTLSQKMLHIIGKVKEVRTHRKMAPIITEG